MRRGALQVVAAEGDAKKAKKGISTQEYRAAQAEDRRQHNKAIKSACYTRVKKVMKMAEAIKADAKAGGDVAALEKLVAEAYKEIDMAVQKGIFHANNGARKKARCAKHKREAVIATGGYKPTPEQPGYAFFQRMQAKATAA